MEGFIRGMRQFVSWSHLEQLLSLIHQIDIGYIGRVEMDHWTNQYYKRNVHGSMLIDKQ